MTQYITDNGEGGPCAVYPRIRRRFCPGADDAKIIAVTRGVAGPDHSAKLMAFRRQIGRRRPVTLSTVSRSKPSFSMERAMRNAAEPGGLPVCLLL